MKTAGQYDFQVHNSKVKVVDEGGFGANVIVAHFHEFRSDSGFDYVTVRDTVKRILGLFGNTECECGIQTTDRLRGP